MLRLKSIAALALTAGLSLAAPTFASAANVRTETHKDVRTETREVRGNDRRDDHFDNTRIQRDIRVERDVRVNHDIHVDRDIRVNRDWHDRDWHSDRIHIGIGPVYAPPTVYVPEPVYVPAPVYVEPNTDITVGLNTIPAFVLNTVSAQNLGAVENARFVRQDGLEFYRFLLTSRNGNFDVHVAMDGRLLSTVAC